jgi:hypothetical protein
MEPILAPNIERREEDYRSWPLRQRDGAAPNVGPRGAGVTLDGGERARPRIARYA